MKTKLIRLFKSYETIIKYFACSCLSTVLDAIIVRVLFRGFDVELVLSNTAGVVAGFILGYILSANKVFRVKYSLASFAVFFGTFLLGLFMANFLIDRTYELVLGFLPEVLAFWTGKGVSIVVPFFVMYFIRKFLYSRLREREEK